MEKPGGVLGELGFGVLVEKLGVEWVGLSGVIISVDVIIDIKPKTPMYRLMLVGRFLNWSVLMLSKLVLAIELLVQSVEFRIAGELLFRAMGSLVGVKGSFVGVMGSLVMNCWGWEG